MKFVKFFLPILLPALLIASYFIIANMVFGTASPSIFLFGLPCPACGLTRSGLLFLRGRFIQSFIMHPLLIPAGLFAAWAMWLKLYHPTRLKELQNPVLALILSSFMLYIYRMVTLFPYHAPMELNTESLLHNIIIIFQGGI